MKTSRGSMARRTRIGRAAVISLSAVGALGVAVTVGTQGAAAHASDDRASTDNEAAPRAADHSREGQAHTQFSAPQGKAPSAGTKDKAPHASSSGS